MLWKISRANMRSETCIVMLLGNFCRVPGGFSDSPLFQVPRTRGTNLVLGTSFESQPRLLFLML